MQTWVGGTTRSSLTDLDAARHAVRTTQHLAVDTDLVTAAAEADAHCAAAVDTPGTLLAAYGIDPRTWELVTFTLHAEHPGQVPASSETFQVLHLSAPGHDRLPGRVETRMAVPR